MNDQTTLTPFERRLAVELERYARGINDPTPTAGVASRAMAAPRRGWFGFDPRLVRLALVAALLAIGLVAAILTGADRRPMFGAWVLTVGCGSDVTCPEGEGVWITRPNEDAHQELFADQPVTMAHATWTHDGRAVIATDQHDLYVTDLEGTSRRILTCKLPCLGIDDPAVSLDGSMLAYTVSLFPTYLLGAQEVTGSMRLEVAPLAPDGTLGPPRILVETQANGETGANQIYGPRWSPDGRSIVFWEDRVEHDGRTTGAAVFTVGMDGAPPSQRTDWSTYAGDADWSPDGASIVYSTFPTAIARPSDPGYSNLWLLPDAAGAARQLTFSSNPSYRSMQPRFRADGSIVYMVAKPGTPEVHVLDPVTLRDDTVMTGRMRIQPEWQPAPGG